MRLPTVVLVVLSMVAAQLAGCGSTSLMEADDTAHPIPYLDKIDAEVLTDKAMYYILTIAAPLGGSARSLRRLALKCESYMESLASPHVQGEMKRTGATRQEIHAYIDPASSAEAKSALLACRERAAVAGIRFEISERLPSPEAGGAAS
jgi:hypothetical protein